MLSDTFCCRFLKVDNDAAGNTDPNKILVEVTHLHCAYFEYLILFCYLISIVKTSNSHTLNALMCIKF